MKPTLGRIKTDESVWPDGATHYIERDFQKWVGGEEFFWKHGAREWLAVNKSWSPEEYAQRGYKIIHRPTKAEWLPKVGEWCEASGGAKVFYVGLDYNGKHVFAFGQEGLARYKTLEGLKASKTERELFVAAARSVWNGTYVSEPILGELYDAGCRFMESTK